MSRRLAAARTKGPAADFLFNQLVERVGIALRAVAIPLVPLLILVSITTTVFTFIGLEFGARLGERYERAAGTTLVTLAARSFPKPPRGYESASDHFFRQSSRTLLESLLQVAAPREPQSIPKLLEPLAII